MRFSTTGRAVTGEEHERWFATIRSADSRTRLWIGEESGAPVGQVRIDSDDDDGGIVSIAVSAACRGRGIGTAMLRALLAEVSGAPLPGHLIAFVRPDNAASLRVFQAVGFHPAPDVRSDFLELRWP